MQDEMLKAVTTYGLGVVLAVSMAVFMAWLIKYILQENAKREERFAGIIERDLEGIKKAMIEQTEKYATVRERMDEANRRTREEHERFDKVQHTIAEGLQILMIKMETNKWDNGNTKKILGDQ